MVEPSPPAKDAFFCGQTVHHRQQETENGHRSRRCVDTWGIEPVDSSPTPPGFQPIVDNKPSPLTLPSGLNSEQQTALNAAHAQSDQESHSAGLPSCNPVFSNRRRCLGADHRQSGHRHNRRRRDWTCTATPEGLAEDSAATDRGQPPARWQLPAALAVALSSKRQRLGDMLARTYVVRIKKLARAEVS
jgi:hypothetical protein